MPHISPGWHDGRLLSSEAAAQQKIARLFVIAMKCFLLQLEMKDGVDGD